MGNNKVVIMRCEEYDRELIGQIVSEGMKRLDYKPSGKVFVKPNVVYAYKTDRLGAHAYTQPTLVGAVISALASSPGVGRVDVGENCAVGTPTRLCFKHAGYYDEIKRVRKSAPRPVDIFCIDEERREEAFVGGAVHDTLRIARKMARADSKVYLPKLKCHCVSGMTGAVKLNIGICSDDERSIRHDFMLNEKIVDLLTPGYPDFIVMDAIDVGVGNEAFPAARKLGLILMGKNPLAVDLAAIRLLGLTVDDVPYLRLAIKRGYVPVSIEELTLEGDLSTIEQLDEQAKRIMPYDDEFRRWQDIETELKRLNTPMRLYFGPYKKSQNGEKCLTGCIMGLKMFLGLMEAYSGTESFAKAKAVVFVVGRIDEEVDAGGEEVFLLGTCAEARIKNAKKVIRLNNCFVTASDMGMVLSHKLGMRAPVKDLSFMAPFAASIFQSSFNKLIKLRYFQDFGYFLSKKFKRRI